MALLRGSLTLPELLPTHPHASRPPSLHAYCRLPHLPHHNVDPCVPHVQEWTYATIATTPDVADTPTQWAVRGVYRYGAKGDFVNIPCPTNSQPSSRTDVDDVIFTVMPNIVKSS